MKIEIETQGKSFGTTVKIDGILVKKCTKVAMSIDAGGYAVLEIERYVTDEQGNIQVERLGNNVSIKSELVRFQGKISLEVESSETISYLS